MDAEKVKTITRLAEEAFKASERVKALMYANVPTDYDERKTQAINYALALAEQREAQHRLDAEIDKLSPAR